MVVKCPNCQHYANDLASTCPHCGTILKNDISSLEVSSGEKQPSASVNSEGLPVDVPQTVHIEHPQIFEHKIIEEVKVSNPSVQTINDNSSFAEGEISTCSAPVVPQPNSVAYKKAEKNNNILISNNNKKNDYAAETEPPKKKSSLLFYILLGVLALIVVFVVFYYFSRDVSPRQEEKEEEVVEVSTPQITTIYDDKGEAIYSFNGEVVDNQPNGYGVLTYLKDNEIDRYEGHMVNGQREDNSAVLFYKNGDLFRGAFKNDQFEIGTYYVDNSGEYFRGTFKNNKPWKGFWYDAHDYVISRVENGRAK